MKLKILHIIDSGGLYGAETVLLHLAVEQARMGLHPVLASIGVTGEGEKAVEAEARQRGVPVEPFRMRPGPNPVGVASILRYARSREFDLLHTHGYKSNILFGLLPSWLRRFPIVSTMHGWTWTGGMTRMRAYEWLDAVSLRFMDRVVLVNPLMRDHPRLRNGNREHYRVVPNGIPLGNGNAPDAPLRQDIVDFAGQGTCLVAVGRLSQEKGFALLLQALADLVTQGHDLRLVLMGDGGLRTQLSLLANDLGIVDRVLMPGFVPAAGMYLNHFDLFVMPSLTEGLPMVLLEAMAAGVPVVASRVGGIPEVLDNGRAGLLVDPGDAGALGVGIAEALVHTADLEERTRHARQRVKKRYSSQAMATQYRAVYDEALALHGLGATRSGEASA